MKEFVYVVVLMCLSALTSAKEASPEVQVYSRNPGEFDKPNVLICHVKGFYPPEIRIDLLKDGEEIPNAKQTDLAFEENWHYHLTKHAPFTPTNKEKYSCKVTHMGKPQHYSWEPDM